MVIARRELNRWAKVEDSEASTGAERAAVG
jgi:hypothetical protein